MSKLAKRIRELVDEHPRFGGVVRVSVAREMSWEEFPSQDSRVHVRWCCFGLEKDGLEVTEPEFCLLGEAATLERIAEDLPLMVPGVEWVFDHEVEG